MDLSSLTYDLGSQSLLTNHADSLATNFTNLCKHIDK